MHQIYTIVQKFGVGTIFLMLLKEVSNAHQDRVKYSKNLNTVKY